MKQVENSKGLKELIAKAKEEAQNHDWAYRKVLEASRAASNKEAGERRSFPLRPSSALKSRRDLYYGLCNYYHPGSISTDAIRNPILLDLGHAVEGHLVKHLERAFKIVHRNHRVEYGSVIGPDTVPIVLTGELDFCIENDKGETILCDSKTIAEFGFKMLNGPKEEHIAQLHCYLRSEWARSLNITRAMLFYYNKNTSELRIYEFTYDPAIADAVVARFQEVMDAYTRLQLPKREYVFGQDWQATYTDFKTHDLEDFEKPLDARLSIFDAAFPTDGTDKEITRFIATEHGNAVVNGYYLTVGAKGLLLKFTGEMQNAS